MAIVSDYDVRRGSAHSRGYTARWDRAAAAFKRINPLCLGCSAVGRVAPAELVDHVVPHKGDRDRFWDQGMWQPACRFHHDVVKQQLEGKYERGVICAADLWLDSSAAIALTKRESSSIGEDGWPVDR